MKKINYYHKNSFKKNIHHLIQNNNNIENENNMNKESKEKNNIKLLI